MPHSIHCKLRGSVAIHAGPAQHGMLAGLYALLLFQSPKGLKQSPRGSMRFHAFWQGKLCWSHVSAVLACMCAQVVTRAYVVDSLTSPAPIQCKIEYRTDAGNAPGCPGASRYNMSVPAVAGWGTKAPSLGLSFALYETMKHDVQVRTKP